MIGRRLGYFAVRAAMARSLTQALRQVAGRGVIDESASALVRLLSQIASRFGVVVSQKVAAQAVPLLGALSGAVVNSVFIDHFQTLAWGHFTVRRLERLYGKGTVRLAYDQIRGSEKHPEAEIGIRQRCPTQEHYQFMSPSCPRRGCLHWSRPVNQERCPLQHDAPAGQAPSRTCGIPGVDTSLAQLISLFSPLECRSHPSSLDCMTMLSDPVHETPFTA